MSAPSNVMGAKAWRKFQELAKAENVGIYSKLNPLSWPAHGRKVPVIQFLLKQEQPNILLWTRDMIESGRSQEAAAELNRIRGIGRKLAAFYMRDVARFFNLPEKPGYLFQPVDLWIGRIAGLWTNQELNIQSDVDYNAAAEIFCQFAEAAEVLGGDLNAGAWILGSQLSNGNLKIGRAHV